MDAVEHKTLTARWIEAMCAYVDFLCLQESQNVEVAVTLTVLELPNLFALLDLLHHTDDAEATINLATSLYSLLQWRGKPRLLEHVGWVRDAAARALDEVWNHARFNAAWSRIQQQLGSVQLREAFYGAQSLLNSAQSAGEQAYSGADYDLAMACILLARVLKDVGRVEKALPLIDEARLRFEAFAKVKPGRGAEQMAAKCFSEQGACLWYLGRLDEATAAYEECILRSEVLDDYRAVAVGKVQIGSICSDQRRYPEALLAFEEARERFMRLNEPGTIAAIWHQTGIVYQKAKQPEAAENAYRKSLAIAVQLGDAKAQAATLSQLRILYDLDFGQLEETVKFFRQAAEKCAELVDHAKEGLTLSNLAEALRRLHRFDEARQNIHRAVECDALFGHASQPWRSWYILAKIEKDAGNSSAATEANRKAIACYLSYRRDGGENHFTEGRISLAVTQFLLAGDPTSAASFLQQFADSDAERIFPFIRAVQTIVAGSRDRALADDPNLDYSMATEILFLIETLEKAPLAPK